MSFHSMPAVVQMLGNDSVLLEAKHPCFFADIDILRTKTPVIPTSSTKSITLLEARLN